MDHDDSMLSTPSSHGDEDDLFPTGTAANTNFVAAQTPQNDHLNAAAPGELSPPRSQSFSAPSGQTNGFGSTVSRGQIDGDAELITDDDEAIDVKDGRAEGKGGRESKSADKQKPGAGWKNKKAQEQMQMAWDHIVDRDFDVKQFGDVLLQSVKEK